MSVNYDFAHRELRELALEDPRTMLGMLSDPAGLAAMARVWNKISELGGSASGVTSRDFVPAVRALPDGTQVGIVGLPKAAAMCEALMVAVVMGPSPRYFTLEVTMRGPELDRRGNVLCEWRREEKGYGHANHGAEVMPEDAEGFLKAIAALLPG
ncbi:MAG: hypothetical protein HYZ75_08540 [Elusimicrobia bacterium]|nr:hypothetical protein [Elusimicrobiota bacterium]